MVKRFEEAFGKYLALVPGQTAFAFSHTDTNDFYDPPQWADRGGYPGSALRFHELATGRVFLPFPKTRDAMFGDPMWSEGRFWFLRGDFAAGSVTLFGYTPGETPEPVRVFPVGELELYNLRLLGETPHVVSCREVFHCYYPMRISFPVDGRETPTLLTADRIYLESWVEEGWDDEQDRAGDDYVYYNVVRVRDFAGRLLHEEKGYLFQGPDGGWYLG